jgi:two-component system response regulator AtoC
MFILRKEGNPMPHILIVEDDANSAAMLSELVTQEGFSAVSAGSLGEARRAMAIRRPDLVLLDLVLPDGSGMDLFADVESLDQTDVVLITGHATVETSVQALRLGASDYLVKPIEVAHLQRILQRHIRPAEIKAQIGLLKQEVSEQGRFGRLWGASAAMRKMHDQIARVAPTSVTVLIVGESGTGKELVAQTIHDLSRRRKNAFIAVNCGAISPHLIESEMFGHEKGSFTGANRQHRGYFEQAEGGTLFLDEITEMPQDLQVKLLRVLETNSFMRVGSTQMMRADVRILAATNRIPMEAVTEGKLREDLLYRLQVFPLSLPPLRDRPEDIAILANHFLDELNAAESSQKTLSQQALDKLNRHHWPGNVRELRNVVSRAFIMSDAAAILADALPGELGTPQRDNGPILSVRVGSTIADVERRLILATLVRCGGAKEKAADILGISLKTLYNRLKEYGSHNATAENQQGNEPISSSPPNIGT